jgi:hypothetical protein
VPIKIVLVLVLTGVVLAGCSRSGAWYFSDSNGRQYGPFQTKAECEQTRSQIPTFLRPSPCGEGSTR